MSIFSRKPKYLEPKRSLELIHYAAKPLPELGELPDVPHLTGLDAITRANLLRRLYLDIEERSMKRPDAPWPDEKALRIDIAKRFRIEKLTPTGFTILFLSRGGQLFWLFRTMLEEMWKRAEWGKERVMAFFAEAASSTPLEEVRTLSDVSWQAAYHVFAKLPEEERERATIDAFKRLIDKSFREFVTERGESRARIALEEVGRALNEDFRILDVIAEVMQVLPEGVLAEDRIEYSSKEELQDTVRKQMQELRGKNMALIAEAKQLHETIQRLEDSKDRAEAMAKAQQDFVQVVMHQFRTPLAALRWQAEALSDFSSDHPEFEDVASMSTVLRERSSFLVGQLENIFDLLALQSGDYQIRTADVDLGHELETLCQEMRKDAEMKGIALTCSAGDAPTVTADSDAIHRVLRIIITNAINYSDEGGSVSVSHEVVRRGEGDVRVHMKDTGIGIRPDDRPKLFTKFFRSRSAIHKVPDGAGIGLFIAKRIVELHDGRMWADSPGEAEGATFSFSLPLKSESPTSPVAQSSVPASVITSAPPPPAATPVSTPPPTPSLPPTSAPATAPEPLSPPVDAEERKPEPPAAVPKPSAVPTPPPASGDVDPLLGA